MADNATIEIKGIEERIKQYGEASTKNPMMQKRITEVIRQVLRKAQKTLQGDAKTGLDMDSDPRHASKGVRMAVYRRVFGGNLNIISSRKAGAGHFYAPPRQGTKDPKGRGGNRRKRNDRTIEMMSYQGKDRGMVLRWLSEGTYKSPERKTRYGKRGGITARNWFGRASQAEMEKAVAEIDKMIDEIIQGVLY